jgi:hypothetical protein
MGRWIYKSDGLLAGRVFMTGLELAGVIALMLILALPVSAQVVDGPRTVSSTTTVQTESALPPVAPIAAQVCQKGLSGQVESGGFSILDAEGFCDWVRLSDVMLAASLQHKQMGNLQYADMYMGYHHNALENANALVTKTSYTTYLDRLFRAMLIPLMMVIGLVILI